MTKNKLIHVAAAVSLIAAALSYSGCTTSQTTATSRTVSKTHSLAFPTGDRSTSAVLLEKILPEQIILGRPFNYSMVVTNLTDMTLETVRISEILPENFTLTSSSPYEATMQGNTAVWTIPSLAPRASETLNITGTANSGTQFATCAEVTYRAMLCVTTPVVSPAIALAVRLASAMDTCTETQIVYTVTNNGSATLTDVNINTAIPSGITVVRGESTIRVNSLAPGASESFTVDVKPNTGGTYNIEPTATSSEGVTANTTASTTVSAPVLVASASAPEQVLIVRTITYAVGVTNTGNTTAGATMVSASLPAHATFVSATDGGIVDAGNVVWQVSSLAPGGVVNYSFTVKPERGGAFPTTVRATNDCAGVATAAAETQVVGIPALLLEVADLNDPVAVGDDVVYEIVVTNQGSALANNIVLKIVLEDNERYVSSTGETTATVSGREILMAPIVAMEIGGKAVYRVTVRTTAISDTRFTVIMTSSDLNRPVQETESTNIY